MRQRSSFNLRPIALVACQLWRYDSGNRLAGRRKRIWLRIGVMWLRRCTFEVRLNWGKARVLLKMYVRIRSCPRSAGQLIQPIAHIGARRVTPNAGSTFGFVLIALQEGSD